MKKNSSVSHLPPGSKATLLNALENAESILTGKHVTAGFDGFTDTIARIIRKKRSGKPPAYFTSIKEFGEYITGKHSASFSLEIEETNKKPGGNMPLMSHTLGTLGIKVDCIGAFGYPRPHEIFNTLSPNCILNSFSEPGSSTAFEFRDGKMFLAQMGDLNSTGWDEITNKIGADKLKTIILESDLVCLLNWSEIDASTNIWKGLLEDIFPFFHANKNPYLFIDLSDCSKRSKDALGEALQLINEFGKYGRVILSLNKNEAGIISSQVSPKKRFNDLLNQGGKIFASVNLHALLIHSARETIALRGEEQVRIPTFYTPKPLISTGAGDNFNAGFCAAQLLELDLTTAVVFANAAAGFYIRSGIPPRISDIKTFLEKQ